MAGRNGAAALPGMPRILRVVPQTTTYTVERPDGETVALAGYHKGPTCPIPVAIEVDAAYETWESAQPTPEERQKLKPRAFLALANRTELVFRRDLLCAVIPGLEMDAANALCCDGGQYEQILTELGWLDAPAAADEDTADPEAPAPADAPTGAPSSPDSTLPTRASIS